MSLIALGVTGGIGAYKAVEVCRGLQKRGHDVVAVMTRSATRFVGPVTFEAITRRPVITSQWRPGMNADIEHIAIADGIIRLGNRRDELRAIREVEVLKLRGANVVTGGHFFEITGEGLVFFPRVRGPDGSFPEPEGLDARAATGVAGLIQKRSAVELDGRAGEDRTSIHASVPVAGEWRHGDFAGLDVYLKLGRRGRRAPSGPRAGAPAG